MKIAPRPLSLRLAAASLLMLAASACGNAPSATAAAPAAGAPTANKAEALWKKIQAANADTSCDSQAQCHTIGFGSKACGGPERYMAWSSKNSDGAALKALIDQHAAARRADDAREQMMSTCSLVSDPGATCRAGQCVTNAISPGNTTNPRRAD